MRQVLIFGAGKSASHLIRFLLKEAPKQELQLTIADLQVSHLQKFSEFSRYFKAIPFDVTDIEERQNLIKQADLVISMLPAALHIDVATECLAFKKHLVTASYVSPKLKAMHNEVAAQGLVFLNEIGCDPGIDHMSAMQTIDRIKSQGGKMILFESFTGGLIAPESDNNLWNYKFTWNPRNVVLAGQGGAAKFIQEGSYKYIPYQHLFRRTEFLNIDGYGKFEAYANRDSLSYREVYGLTDVKTMYRGTIRKVGFSRAWHVFVQLGMTDDSYQIEHSENLSYREFVNLFLPYHPSDSVELKFRHALKIDQDDIIWDKYLSLDIFSKTKKIGLKNASPAQALQKILMDNWTLAPEDKDMIVMCHKFGYELDGQEKQIDATMVVIGEDNTFTAMSKTVGLPVGIAALAILNSEICTPGVVIPVKSEVYNPVMTALENEMISFNEKEVPYTSYNTLHL